MNVKSGGVTSHQHNYTTKLITISCHVATQWQVAWGEGHMPEGKGIFSLWVSKYATGIEVFGP